MMDEVFIKSEPVHDDEVEYEGNCTITEHAPMMVLTSPDHELVPSPSVQISGAFGPFSSSNDVAARPLPSQIVTSEVAIPALSIPPVPPPVPPTPIHTTNTVFTSQEETIECTFSRTSPFTHLLWRGFTRLVSLQLMRVGGTYGRGPGAYPTDECGGEVATDGGDSSWLPADRRHKRGTKCLVPLNALQHDPLSHWPLALLPEIINSVNPLLKGKGVVTHCNFSLPTRLVTQGGRV
ncbi:hypothetical protein F0562_024573 [Nyssa sinensis]|uniref:Uncharacterized protein n=1 Tax=Nyssa sinensis TaxID=561372 RepID=A0A5J5BCS9_9ASTE|nr:hypothetical protein F0562_024573 [Nyssa sinensis]